MKHITKISALLTSSILAATSAPALAQNTIDDEGVPRLPSIIETKTFIPEALMTLTTGGSAGIMYKDNVFRSTNNEKSDFAAILAPGFAIRTHGDDSEFRLKAKVEGARYFKESENDYVDLDVIADGEIDLDENWDFIASGRLRYDHVDIGAFVDTPDRIAAEPTRYFYAESTVGFEYEDDESLYFLADVLGKYYNYMDTDQRGGTVSINDDRDRKHLRPRVRVGGYVEEETVAYVEGSYNIRDYDKMIDSTATVGRDSNGYGIALGLMQNETDDPEWFDVNAGLVRQNYDNAAMKDVNTLGLSAAAQLMPAPDTELRLQAGRTVEENSLVGASSYVRSRIGAELAYQAAPKWKIGISGRYTNNDFQTRGVPAREDDVYDGSVYAEYQLEGNWVAGVEYIHVTRESTDNTVEYKQNAVLATIALKY